MISVRGLVTAIAAAMFLVVQTADAQCVLPSGLSEAANPLTPSDQRQVDNFVECWLDQMTLDDADSVDIALAQTKLTREIKIGSEFFKTALSRSISSQLKPALESENPAVRVNAAIITSTLIDSTASDLAIMGLSDKNPAVRYWSARSITTMAAKLPPDKQQKLFNALAGAFKNEPSANVEQQMLASVIELKIPAAFNLAVNALNKRAAFHFNNPSASLRADIYIINKINTGLVRQDDNKDAIRKMMGVSCRYLEVCTKRIRENIDISQLTKEDVKQIKSVDGYLRYATEKLNKKLTMPVSITIATPDELALITAEWKQLLIKNFKFKAEYLNLDATE